MKNLPVYATYGKKVLGCRSREVCPFIDDVKGWCESLTYEKHDFNRPDDQSDEDWANRFQINHLNVGASPIMVKRLEQWAQGVCYEVYGLRAEVSISQVNRYSPEEICHWHTDSHTDTLSLTIGASRNLLFRKKGEEYEQGHEIALGHGDFFAFNGHHSCDFQHAIMGEPGCEGMRYLIVFNLILWPMEDPCKLMIAVPRQFTPKIERDRLKYERDAPKLEDECEVDCFDEQGELNAFPYFIFDKMIDGQPTGTWLSSYAEARHLLHLPMLLKDNPCEEIADSSAED